MVLTHQDLEPVEDALAVVQGPGPAGARMSDPGLHVDWTWLPQLVVLPAHQWETLHLLYPMELKHNNISKSLKYYSIDYVLYRHFPLHIESITDSESNQTIPKMHWRQWDWLVSCPYLVCPGLIQKVELVTAVLHTLSCNILLWLVWLNYCALTKKKKELTNDDRNGCMIHSCW